MLEAWINYLALRATGVEKTLQFVSQSKNDIFKGTEISQQEAMDTLKELVGLYKEGHKEVMPFDMGLNIIPDDLGNPDTEKFNGIFGAAVKKMFDTFGYPCSDAYLIREYEGGTFSQAGNEEKYRKVAEKLLLPLARLFPSYPFKKFNRSKCRNRENIFHCHFSAAVDPGEKYIHPGNTDGDLYKGRCSRTGGANPEIYTEWL